MKSTIEISGARLAANLAAVQAVAGLEFEVLAVIKADAYGHGAEMCAAVLAEAGVRWIGVTDLEEGERIRRVLTEASWAADGRHIVVMSGFELDDAPGIVRAGLTPVVWTSPQVEALERAAAGAGEYVAVHLEVDTGMARQGAAPGADLATVLDALRRSPHVRCEGVFSHISSSEVVGSPETIRQERRFGEAKAQLDGAGLIPEWIHFGNSAAVEEGSTLTWLQSSSTNSLMKPMVRPGLALYGYVLPLEGYGRAARDEVLSAEVELGREDRRGSLRGSLQPVATWKARVIGLREIQAGDTAGYGATFVAERPMRLALLPVGYADGFRREASSGMGNGWVMIAGQRAPVVGRVSMNLTVVDVTGCGVVLEGSEVVLLGDGVTAEDHARWAGTIPYEILCGMRGHRRLV